MTDKYAVIGNPISHSKSPQIHTMFAEQTGQDISYEKIEAPLDGFAATVERLRKKGYKGCNVTVPFKFEAFKLATKINPLVQGAKTVNTLKFSDHVIQGDNTDGIGLVRDIEKNLHMMLKGKQVLLMGAGGAAWGIQLNLLMAGIQSLVVANRTIDKAEALVRGSHAFEEVLQIPISAKAYDELSSEQFDIVINATSAGLTDSALPLPPTVFSPGALAYDLMYGRETPFMKFARANGAAIVSDGLGMLVEQAAESFYIWRGVLPETAPVIAKLRGQP